VLFIPIYERTKIFSYLYKRSDYYLIYLIMVYSLFELLYITHILFLLFMLLQTLIKNAY